MQESGEGERQGTRTGARKKRSLIFRGFDCRDVAVCHTCGELFGSCREVDASGDQRRQLEQLCDCESGRMEQPRWDRFDVNELVTLCRCCCRVALQSGSRWSVWFCWSCKSKIEAVNDACEAYVIPIGRHSMMASKYRTGSMTSKAVHIPKLRSTLRDIGHRTSALLTHARQTTLGVALSIDEQTPCTLLSDYLRTVQQLEDHQPKSFTALCKAMGVPTAVVRNIANN